MAAPIGFHLRGLSPVCRCMRRCVLACTRAATWHHTSAFQICCVCKHSLSCALYACVRVWNTTVMLYDRMITPFSQQLQGVSLLHSSAPPPPPSKELCTFTYVKACFPVGSNTLHLIFPPLFLPRKISGVLKTLNSWTHWSYAQENIQTPWYDSIMLPCPSFVVIVCGHLLCCYGSAVTYNEDVGFITNYIFIG